jgi:hypothetical protein
MPLSTLQPSSGGIGSRLKMKSRMFSESSSSAALKKSSRSGVS